MKQIDSMGWMARLAAAALLAMATMTASTAPVMAADGRDWRVSDIKGDAQIQSKGDWRTLKRGDLVRAGSQVKTGDAGRVILVRPGDSLDVAPNSEFTVPKAADNGDGRPATHISQSRGTILFKITTRPENPFTVKTPYLAAVIKGTTFTVSVDREDSALHVSKGAVQVASILTGQTVLVGPGQTAAVNARNGGNMRLIGFQKSDAGGRANNPSNAASVDIDESKAGRGNITTVIPRAVGVTDVDIGKVSKGLVNGPPGAANGHVRNGKAGSGGNSGKGGGNGVENRAPGNGAGVTPIFSNPVPATYRGGNVNGIGNGVGNGGGIGNGGGNANGIGNGGGNGNGNGNSGGGMGGNGMGN